MPRTPVKPSLTALYEESYFVPEVDRDAGIIRNVKVLGTVSKNGREYSEQAKRDAKQIFEGCTVNIDHNRDNPGRERGFLEGVGTLNGLRIEADGVYANEFRVKKAHPAANLIFESAERFPKNFGLSINASGKMGRRNGLAIVESIVVAQSVDIVGKPGTTDGLFESVQVTGRGSAVVKRTIKQLIESHGNTDQKGRLSKLLEASGGDAAMIGQPVDVPPLSSDDEYQDGDSTASDPMCQISDAFAALVISVMENAALDLKAKVAQITTILTTQEQLVNGTAVATPVKEDDESGGDDMAESALIKKLDTTLTSLIESQKRNEENQKRSDAKIQLLESGIEATTDRIKSLSDAKDDDARKTLLESWPKAVRNVAKPRVATPLVESENATFTYPKDHKSFIASLR